MKYNSESFDRAINILLPRVKEAIDSGINFNRVDCLKMIAEDYFINTIDNTYNPSHDERIAIFICQEARKDLQQLGQFVFGGLDFEATKELK